MRPNAAAGPCSTPCKVELANKRAPLEERKKKRKLSQADGEEGAAEEPTDAAAKPEAKQQEGKQQQPPAKQQAAAKGGKAAAAANGDTAAPAAAEPPVKRQKPAAGAADGPARAKDAKAAAAAAEKHKLLRAVAVGNLTPAAVGLAVSLARKAGPVEEVQNPAPQVRSKFGEGGAGAGHRCAGMAGRRIGTARLSATGFAGCAACDVPGAVQRARREPFTCMMLSAGFPVRGGGTGWRSR